MFEVFEFADFRVDIREFAAQALADRRTGAATVRPQVDQLANLRQREAQLLHTPYKVN
ncbi:MAG TPA: hypothetical protein VJN21_07465 [Candidatus Acidoferrales bacterium]|nr:hypothetical protein [Candidatus Acidoferrales bacterium]